MVLPRIFSSSSVLYSDSIFLAAIVFLAFFLISGKHRLMFAPVS